MNSDLPYATHFTHLDLATGRSALVPLALEPEKQRDTLPILLQSQKEGVPFTWAAGMLLFADLALSGQGAATIMLSAAFDMCGGQIKQGQTVYSMGLAVSPRKAGRPWETLGNIYLNVMLRGGNSLQALGEIPDEHPWAAGFAWPCAELLGEKGNLTLVNYARLAAATALNRCREVYVTDVAHGASFDPKGFTDGDDPFGMG